MAGRIRSTTGKGLQADRERLASGIGGPTWQGVAARVAQTPHPIFRRIALLVSAAANGSTCRIANAAHDCNDTHFELVALIGLSASIIAKWPNTLSYAMDVDHTRPHRRIKRFQLDKVLSMYLGRLDRCIANLGELHRIYGEVDVPGEPKTTARVVYPHDARDPIPELEEGSQALVVTSPPYFNAVDYPRAHRLSVCWMNGYAPADLVSRRKYIGLRHAPGFDPLEWLNERPAVRRFVPVAIRREDAVFRRLTAFYVDLADVLLRSWEALQPGGHAVYIIANNIIKGQRIKSHRVIAELAKELGFDERKIDTRKIESLRRRFPVGPFGFDGPMTHEYLIVLRKPKPRKQSKRGGNARSS